MDFNEYKEKRLKESETLKAEYEALAPEYEVKAQLIKLRKSSMVSDMRSVSRSVLAAELSSSFSSSS